jgi:hypothetical protein
MSPAEQTSKLSQIARISSMDEWQGWHDAAKSRGFFPGELAALMRQKEALS